MSKLKLEEVIKITNGLNIISNAGVGIKDVVLAFEISMFKKDAEALVTSFQEAMQSAKGTEKAKENQGNELIQKEYEIQLPEIKLSAFADSKVEVPLIAFDYLREYITKD
jgi:hypothetical protein